MTEPVEPPREMVERAKECVDRAAATENAQTIVDFLAREFAALRSQTLDEAAQKIKDEAESIMRDYVMTGPAGIVKGCIAAIRALPLPPGIK